MEIRGHQPDIELWPSPSRARILETLAAAGRAARRPELGARVGLHPNTVRWHLGVLADAGFVSSSTEPPTRPGRPRVVFTADRGAAEGREDYRLLAAILAGSLSGTETGAAAAEQAGAAWGRFLVERPRPFARLSAGDAADQVVRLLDEHGFEPERENGDVLMRRCPFRDLAEQHGDVVCSVHLGLIRGALAETGAPVTATRLEPFVEPGLCRARLR